MSTTGGTSGFCFAPNANATPVPGASLDAPITDGTTTSIGFTSTASLVAGQIVVIDGECMYIRAVTSGTTANVYRGVSGTAVAGSSGPGSPHQVTEVEAAAYSGTRFVWGWDNSQANKAQQANCAWFLDGITGATLRDFTISSHGRSATAAWLTGAHPPTAWALLCLNNCTNCLIDNVEAVTSGNLGMINQGHPSSSNTFRNVRCHDTIKDGLALAWDGAQRVTAFSPECFDNGDDAISINALVAAVPPMWVDVFGPRVHDGKIDRTGNGSWFGNGIAAIAQHVNVYGGFVDTVCSNGVIIYDYLSTGGSLGGINVTAHDINFIGLDICRTGGNLNSGSQGHGAHVFGAREIRFDGCRFSQIMQHGARFDHWGKNIWFVNNRMGSAGTVTPTEGIGLNPDGIGVQNQSTGSGVGGGNAGAWDGLTIVSGSTLTNDASLATFYTAFNEASGTNSDGTTPPQTAAAPPSGTTALLGFDCFYIEGDEFTACDHAAISIYGESTRHCNIIQVRRNRTANNNLGNYTIVNNPPSEVGPCYFLADMYCQYTDNWDHDGNMFGIPAPTSPPGLWTNPVASYGVTIPTGTKNVGVWSGSGI